MERKEFAEHMQQYVDNKFEDDDGAYEAGILEGAARMIDLLAKDKDFSIACDYKNILPPSDLYIVLVKSLFNHCCIEIDGHSFSVEKVADDSLLIKANTV